MTLRRHLPRRSSIRSKSVKSSPKELTLYHAILNRDFIGARTIVKFDRDPDETEGNRFLWLGYCNFHARNYEKAQSIYITLLTKDYGDHFQQKSLYLACVYYYLQMYEEAKEAASTILECSLKNRLMMHIACKNNPDQTNMIPLQLKLDVKF